MVPVDLLSTQINHWQYCRDYIVSTCVKVAADWLMTGSSYEDYSVTELINIQTPDIDKLSDFTQI